MSSVTDDEFREAIRRSRFNIGRGSVAACADAANESIQAEKPIGAPPSVCREEVALYWLRAQCPRGFWERIRYAHRLLRAIFGNL